VLGRSSIRKNIHQQIVHELATRIISGEIAAGEILATEDIASANMDVSRTAYREAIKVLTAKGLLESRPKVGTRVRDRAKWNMLDPDILLWASELGSTTAFADALFEFRQIIEPAAARLAAEKGSTAQKECIRDALTKMATTEPATRENVKADLEFHAAILRASGNELLSSLNHVVEALLARSFAISSRRPDARETSIPLHQAVCEHIERGQGAQAQSAMATLLSSARDDIDKVMKSSSEFLIDHTENAAGNIAPGRL